MLPVETYTLQYCIDNLPEVNSGSTRTVFIINDDTVVKVPFNRGGIIQCRNELQVFEKYGNILPLCPVLKGSSEDRIFQQKAVVLEECEMQDSEDDGWYVGFDMIFGNVFESYDIDINQYLDSIRDSTDVRIMDFIDAVLKLPLEVIEEVLYDISSYNIGLIDNRIVVVDYGYLGSLQKNDEYFDEIPEKSKIQ